MTDSHHTALVSADWLKTHIGAPDLRVVDATWIPPFLVGRKSGDLLYKQAHIPGAVFFDIDAVAARDSDMPHMLPDPVQFSSQVRKMGLGDGNRIVIYDTNGFFASARVWWMFRAMGHKDVMVLNGGLSAWQAVGGETEDLAPPAAERHFTSRKRADLVRTRAQMHEVIGRADTVILDARSQERFTGQAPEPRPDLPSGHMPGSINLPHTQLLSADGRLKEPDALRHILADYLDKSVIATCGSGVSAAIIALALAHIGHWDTAIYDGAWTEWASHQDSPILTNR